MHNRLFQLKSENPMCEHPAHLVNVSRIGVLCAPDCSKFFGTPCIIKTIYFKVFLPCQLFVCKCANKYFETEV